MYYRDFLEFVEVDARVNSLVEQFVLWELGRNVDLDVLPLFVLWTLKNRGWRKQWVRQIQSEGEVLQEIGRIDF